MQHVSKRQQDLLDYMASHDGVINMSPRKLANELGYPYAGAGYYNINMLIKKGLVVRINSRKYILGNDNINELEEPQTDSFIARIVVKINEIIRKINK